jgi:hypothetical protein
MFLLFYTKKKTSKIKKAPVYSFKQALLTLTGSTSAKTFKKRSKLKRV